MGLGKGYMVVIKGLYGVIHGICRGEVGVVF